MKKKIIIMLFLSALLIAPMNNNYVDAAKKTPTKEVATTNYTITYNLNGGKNNKSNPAKYNSKTKTIKLKDATKSGYTFGGWYSDANLKKKVTQIKKGSKGNITLYAKWERYTITYQLNGGTNNKSNPSNYNKNTKTIKLKNPTRKGYDFLGWYRDTKFKKKVTQIKKGSKGNITLYAKWESNADYKIVYNLNGGNNSKSNPTKYNKKTKTIKLKNPTRTGYTFSGWYKDAKFKKKVTQIKKGSKGNLTLYAKWTANTYTIKFNKNGANKGKMSNQTKVKYGSNVKLNANKFTKNGYAFIGWNTKSNGKGKTYTDKASVKNLVTKNKGTITLYAMWANEFKISYNLNGGVNNKANPTKYKLNTEVTLKNPTKKDNKFIGWYTDAKFKNKVTKIVKGKTGNITLYAKWEKIHVITTTKKTTSITTTRKVQTTTKSSNSKDEENKKEQVVKRAKELVKNNTFSYTGLKEFLEKNDKYSINDAKYGADNCGVDWKSQGLRRAQELVSSSNDLGVEFSLDKIKEYLDYAGFNNEEVEYTLKNIDRREYAYEVAKKLLEEGNSKKSLEEFMKERFQFTTIEINYAIESNKVNWKEQALKVYKKSIENGGVHSPKDSLTNLEWRYYSFSQEEIDYALKNYTVDWKNEALKYVKEIYTSQPISKKSIENELSNLEFVEADIKYAIDNCGFDWNSNAILKVRQVSKYYKENDSTFLSYIMNTNGSNFTHSEIDYAIKNYQANFLDFVLIIAKEITKENNISKQEIANKLEKMGFSSVEIEYAKENLKIDWKESALNKTKNILEEGTSPIYIENNLEELGFTKEEINYAIESIILKDYVKKSLEPIEQMSCCSSISSKELKNILLSQGYSTSDIEYVLTLGIYNFKENALKRAKTMYLTHIYPDYNEIIRMLQKIGFTPEETKYAVDNCGVIW